MFVTNSLSFLTQCDRIIMLENGSIVEIGTYEQLKGKSGKFIEFLKSFLEIKEASQDYISNFYKSSLIEKN